MTSMPISRCLPTTPATAARPAAASASSSMLSPRARRANRLVSSGGLGRLPACVVRIRVLVGISLFQNLQRERLETEVVAGVEQDRTVGNGDDLRHQRAHHHVIAGLALGWADLPFAVGIVRDRHEDIEADVGVEAPAVNAVAANGCLQVGLAVWSALCGLAVARDVEMLAAKPASAIILCREVLLDLPHLLRPVAVERVRHGQFPA